jgi:hypothetical protein
MNVIFQRYPSQRGYILHCITKAFKWQLKEFPGLPENNKDLNVALVFELELTATEDHDLCSKWHCAFTDYKCLQEHYEQSKLPAQEEGFKDEGHIPFNSCDFMRSMLPVVTKCPENHVTAFYWDLRMGNLIEYEYISYL